MKIDRLIVGNYQTNCYFLIYNQKCLIFDPGDDFNKIDNYILNNKLIPLAILVTHNHFDHIGAINDLISKYSIKKYDYYNLKEGKNNINEFNFEVIYTPGHTNDSITFYFKELDIMIDGDFIFNGDIGRTDLPTGNMNKMMNSIKKIKKYPKETIMCPGHDNSITLNNFFKTFII